MNSQSRTTTSHISHSNKPIELHPTSGTRKVSDAADSDAADSDAAYPDTVAILRKQRHGPTITQAGKIWKTVEVEIDSQKSGTSQETSENRKGPDW